MKIISDNETKKKTSLAGGLEKLDIKSSSFLWLNRWDVALRILLINPLHSYDESNTSNSDSVCNNCRNDHEDRKDTDCKPLDKEHLSSDEASHTDSEATRTECSSDNAPDYSRCKWLGSEKQ